MNTPDPAMAESVRWLLEQQTLVRAPKREPLPTPITGGGSAPTVVVAASNSTQYSKDRADFICTGVNDEMTIQRALNICDANAGGIVWLCEGGYFLEIPTADAAIVVPVGVSLVGVGDGLNGAGASLEMQNVTDPGRLALIRMRGHSEVRGLSLYTFDSALGIRLTDFEGLMRITDCWIETRDGAAIEGHENVSVWVERNMLWVNDAQTDADSCIHIDGNGLINWWVTRNWILSGWHGIHFDGDQGRNFFHDNVIEGAWYSGIRLQNDVNPIFATSIIGNLIMEPGRDSDGSTGEGCIYISADAADIDPLTVQSNGLIIANNKIEIAAVVYGVRLSGVALIQVHDNYFEQAGLHGIFLEDANWCEIHDNLIQEPNTFPTDTYDGIHLVTSDGNKIIRNTVIEHGGGSPNYWRYGINISDAASDDNVVMFNDLRLAGSGTDFFNDAGTGTIIDPPAGAPYGSNLT